MAATVVVVELTGAGMDETVVNVANPARYCNMDNSAPGLVNPCVVPAANFGYSWWKSHSLNISGTYTQVNNIRWYTDGAIGWNFGSTGKLQVGQVDADPTTNPQGVPTANYDQATGNSTTGNDLWNGTNGHAFLKNGVGSATVDAEDFDSVANAMLVDDTDYGPNTTNVSNSVVSQVVIANDATQGVQAAETVTFVYDEI